MLAPQRFIAVKCILLILLVRSLAAETGTEGMPTFGTWKGFPLGTYVVHKQTYRGASYHKDGVEYRKTILVGVKASGAALYQDYVADSPEGPWKISSAHGDAAAGEANTHRGETREMKELGQKHLAVGDNLLLCAVTQTRIKDDWGTRSLEQWTNAESGLELRRDESFEGQDNNANPVRWTSSLVTTAIQKVVIGKESLPCFVQTHETPWGIKDDHYQTVISAKVPGHRIKMQHWKGQAGIPETEFEMIAWGRDLAALERARTESAHFSFEIQRRREAEEEKRRAEDLGRKAIEDLNSQDESQRTYAITSLTQWHQTQWAKLPANRDAIIAGFKRSLDDPSSKVRRRAALGLGEIGVTGLTQQILELIEKDKEGTFDYIYALGMQSQDQGLAALLKYLVADDEHLRSATAAALRNFKQTAAREALERALSDPSWEVRHNAIESLEHIADPRAVPGLVGALQDQNPLIVRRAIAALGKIGTAAAIEPLVKLTKSPDDAIRMSLALYLGKLHVEDTRLLGDTLLKMIDDASVEVRSAAIGSLAQLREKRAVPRLLALIQNPGNFVKQDGQWFGSGQMALLALGEIKDPSASPILLKLLDQYPIAHDAICEVIGKIGDPDAAPPLFERYAHRSEGDKRTDNAKELEAIGRVADAKLIPSLKQYLENCRPAEKQAVRQAIEAIEKRHAK